MKESSDNTNQPRKLEEVFRDGFEPAEVTPGPGIWNRIEQELDGKQAGYYKRRLAWYQGLAAASIVLLLLAMGYFWYDTKTAHQLNMPASSSVATTPNHTAPPTGSARPQTQVSTLPAETAESETTNLAAISRANRKGPVAKLTAPEATGAPYRTQERALDTDKLKFKRERKVATSDTAGSNKLMNEYPAIPSLALGIDNAHTGTDPDSTQFLVKTAPLSLRDSLAASTASVAPERAKKRINSPRWTLGGGTGSQYFEQNIKFGNPGSHAVAFMQPSYYTYSSAPISTNANGNTVEGAIEEFNKNTRSAFSYRAAAAATYKLNETWSVEAGLIFAENKAQTTTTFIINKRPTALYHSARFLESNFSSADKATYPKAYNITIPVTIFLAELTDGYLDNSNVTITKADPFTMYYRYRQLGVPVKLRYQKGRGNWFTFIQAGGAVNLLLQTSILSDSPQVPEIEYAIGQPSPFRKWYLSALGSVGRGLRISDVWQVQGSLDVARNFSALTVSPDQLPNASQRKPFYLGFGISSNYVIGKKATPSSEY